MPARSSLAPLLIAAIAAGVLAPALTLAKPTILSPADGEEVESEIEFVVEPGMSEYCDTGGCGYVVPSQVAIQVDHKNVAFVAEQSELKAEMVTIPVVLEPGSHEVSAVAEVYGVADDFSDPITIYVRSSEEEDGCSCQAADVGEQALGVVLLLGGLVLAPRLRRARRETHARS